MVWGAVLGDCFPSVGVAPGCGFALFWVQVAMFRPVQFWIHSNPSLHVDIYVDDITVYARAPHKIHPSKLESGVTSLVEALVDMGSKVAHHKTAVVASRKSVEVALRSKVGVALGLPPDTLNLGVDFSAGKMRSAPPPTLASTGRNGWLPPPGGRGVRRP